MRHYVTKEQAVFLRELERKHDAARGALEAAVSAIALGLGAGGGDVRYDFGADPWIEVQEPTKEQP